MAEKQTFAFQAPDPVQGRPSAQGGYNTGQIIGGEVMGGDRSGIGPDQRGAVIGSFLDGLLEPYAQRKSKEAFAKGMTDQMYAEAGEEIRAGNGLLTQVFGPSAYEEGAIFYEAQQRVAQVQNEWAAEEDQLKLLGPDEVAKAWADRLDKAKVGDTFLDGVIQDSLMKASPQMLQSVAKARYGYQQERASRAQADAWLGQGEVLQKQASSLMASGDGGVGYQSALKSFTDLFIPIKGQNDESFKKNLAGTIRTLSMRGQGHAVTALLQSRALDVLDEEDRSRLEQVYERASSTALANAAASPEMIKRIDDLNRDLAFGKLSAPEAIKAKRGINERLKQLTGFDTDYFDASEQAATGKSVWGDVVAKLRREEDKAERIADREDQQQHERDMEQMRATQDAAAADLAWASSSPAMAVASGAVKSEAMKARVLKGFLEDDFAGLDRSFRDAIVADGVKDAIKNTVSSTIDQGYTPEFEKLAKRFAGMERTNGAMAKEYFGSYAPAMRQFQRRVATGASPTVAFASAFGDDAQYAPSGGAVAAASKEIQAAIKEQQPWVISQWITGSYGLNASAQRTLANMVAREVATDRQGGAGDRSDSSLISDAISRVTTLGLFETAGPFGWRNAKGEQPLYKTIGVDKATADRVIMEQIDVSLRNRGYTEGMGGDEYEVIRTKQGGKPMLIVVPQDDKGIPLTNKSVTITVDQLKNAVNERQARNNKAKGILKPDELAWARIDPQRRIKGESVMQRVTRINKEIKLRMDAGLPMYPVD